MTKLEHAIVIGLGIAFSQSHHCKSCLVPLYKCPLNFIIDHTPATLLHPNGSQKPI